MMAANAVTSISFPFRLTRRNSSADVGLIFPWREGQCPCAVSLVLGIVGRVPLAVENYDLFEVEWRHVLEAGDIHAELARVRAALVVRGDAARAAEMMLGGVRVEAVGGEIVFALGDPEVVGRGGHGNGAAHPTDGAGAAPRRRKSLRQRNIEFHRSAVTRPADGHRR